MLLTIVLNFCLAFRSQMSLSAWEYSGCRTLICHTSLVTFVVLHPGIGQLRLLLLAGDHHGLLFNVEHFSCGGSGTVSACKNVPTFFASLESHLIPGSCGGGGAVSACKDVPIFLASVESHLISVSFMP